MGVDTEMHSRVQSHTPSNHEGKKMSGCPYPGILLAAWVHDKVKSGLVCVTGACAGLRVVP